MAMAYTKEKKPIKKAMQKTATPRNTTGMAKQKIATPLTGGTGMAKQKIATPRKTAMKTSKPVATVAASKKKYPVK